MHATRMRTRVAWPASDGASLVAVLHTRPSCLRYTSYGRSNRYSCMYTMYSGRSVMAVGRINQVAALRKYRSTAFNGLLVGT